MVWERLSKNISSLSKADQIATVVLDEELYGAIVGAFQRSQNIYSLLGIFAIEGFRVIGENINVVVFAFCLEWTTGFRLSYLFEIDDDTASNDGGKERRAIQCELDLKAEFVP